LLPEPSMLLGETVMVMAMNAPERK
jgi:hypothetical protein